MTDAQMFDRMCLLLDNYQQQLERLRRPLHAERIRQIAHELALYRFEIFGVTSNTPQNGKRS